MRRALVGLVVGMAATAWAEDAAGAYFRQLREAEGHYWSGRHANALPHYRQLVAQYADDPAMWEHLAECEARARNHSAAVAAWTKAYALGCHRQAECAYEAARSAALAGQPAEAKTWLRKALAHAFERRPQLAGDEAFQSLRQDVEFARLAGMTPQGASDRDARWRYDLDFLVEEIGRMHYRWRTQALPESFQEAVRQLHREIPELDDGAIAVRLQNLMARLGDGHSMLYFFAGPQALPQLPVQLYWFADGLYVVTAAKGYERWLGHRVERIEGMDPAEALQRVAPYVSRDNAMFLKAMGPVLLTTPAFLKAAKISAQDRATTLTMRAPSGEGASVELAAQPARRPLRVLPPPAGTGAAPRYLARQNETFWWERLQGSNLVYVQINQISNSPNGTLSGFSQELSRELAARPAAGVVLDLRHNVGGNSGLLAPLLRAAAQFRQSAPAAPLYVITSRSTYSAAQVLISQLETLAAVTVVGEPSGSSPRFIGEDTQVVLPYSQLMGSVSTRLHQARAIDDRPWIAPQIPVALDSKSYFGNRDPAMEAIVALHSDRK